MTTTSLDAFFDFLQEAARQAPAKLDMGDFKEASLRQHPPAYLAELTQDKAKRLTYLTNAIAAEVMEFAIEVAMFKELEAAARPLPLEVAA